MAGKATVVCRCGKKCDSFKDWEAHLKKKHPKWHKELEASGDLADDRSVFRGDKR